MPNELGQDEVGSGCRKRFFVKPPELCGRMRSKSRHDKSLNIVMSYMLIIYISKPYLHIHSKTLQKFAIFT